MSDTSEPTPAEQDPGDEGARRAKEDTDYADSLRPNILSLGRVGPDGRLIGEPFPYLVGAGENITPATPVQDDREDVRDREDDEAVKRAQERERAATDEGKDEAKERDLKEVPVGPANTPDAETRTRRSPGDKR